MRRAWRALHSVLIHNPLIEEGHIALMRLYAEQGQPTWVLQQYQALEQAWRDNGGIHAYRSHAPDGGKAARGRRSSSFLCPPASLVSPDSAARRSVQPAVSEPAQTPVSSSPSVSAPLLHTVSPDFPAWVACRFPDYFYSSFCFLRSLMVSGTGRLPIAASLPRPLPRVAITRGLEKWKFFYKHGPGEKPDAEGKAIAVDEDEYLRHGPDQNRKRGCRHTYPQCLGRANKSGEALPQSPNTTAEPGFLRVRG